MSAVCFVYLTETLYKYFYSGFDSYGLPQIFDSISGVNTDTRLVLGRWWKHWSARSLALVAANLLRRLGNMREDKRQVLAVWSRRPSAQSDSLRARAVHTALIERVYTDDTLTEDLHCPLTHPDKKNLKKGKTTRTSTSQVWDLNTSVSFPLRRCSTGLGGWVSPPGFPWTRLTALLPRVAQDCNKRFPPGLIRAAPALLLIRTLYLLAWHRWAGLQPCVIFFLLVLAGQCWTYTITNYVPLSTGWNRLWGSSSSHRRTTPVDMWFVVCRWEFRLKKNFLGSCDEKKKKKQRITVIGSPRLFWATFLRNCLQM